MYLISLGLCCDRCQNQMDEPSGTFEFDGRKCELCFDCAQKIYVSIVE